MNATSWFPGLWVLGASLIAAAAYVWMNRKRAAEISERHDQLLDRERKVEVALEQLHELSADAHHLSPEQRSKEQAVLEHKAAAELKARDQLQSEPAPAPSSEPSNHAAVGFWARNPTFKGALIGAGVVLFFGGVGLLLSQHAQPRSDDQQMTGMRPKGASSEGSSSEDAALTQAHDAYRENPDNPDLSARFAHELLRHQKFAEALQVTQSALQKNPQHLETRIHAAVLKGMREDPRDALDELEALGKSKEERATEAWLFAGGLALDLRDPRRALKAFEAYADRIPASEQPPALQQGIALLRQQVAALEGQPVAAVAGRPLPKDHPPIGSEAGKDNAALPPLSPEAVQAVTSVEKTPELLAGLAKRVEEAEADLAAKRFQDALDKYKQVVPVQPENGRARAGMAWALVGLKKPTADRIWGVAVQFDPAAVRQLGQSLARLGDPEGSKALLQRLATTTAGTPSSP